MFNQVSEVGNNSMINSYPAKSGMKGVRKELINHPLNYFGELICTQFQGVFQRYYFGPESGYKVKFGQPITETNNLFARSYGLFCMVFSFNTAIKFENY